MRNPLITCFEFERTHPGKIKGLDTFIRKPEYEAKMKAYLSKLENTPPLLVYRQDEIPRSKRILEIISSFHGQ